MKSLFLNDALLTMVLPDEFGGWYEQIRINGHPLT